MKSITATLVFFIIVPCLWSQDLSSRMGMTYNSLDGSLGAEVAISYSAELPKNFTLNFSFTDAFLESRGLLPEESERTENYLITDRTSGRPVGIGTAIPWQLESRPDKHSIKFIEVGINKFFLVNSHTVGLGLGGFHSFHQHTRILRFVRGSLYDPFTSEPYESGLLPIYEYLKYQDLGFSFSADYKFRFKNGISAGGSLAYRGFIASENRVFHYSVGFGFRLW